jgi:acetylornithine deacetylase/succinyl-diaminopimelate desuccinylase-like protein
VELVAAVVLVVLGGTLVVPAATTRVPASVVGGGAAMPDGPAQPAATASARTVPRRARSTPPASRSELVAGRYRGPMPLSDAASDLVDSRWEEILPVLCDYITIPNVSAAFDPNWREHGHMQRAVELVEAWCRARDITGMTVDVHELDDRTPLVVVEVAAFGAAPADDTVVLYGHLDKQPEMEGWREGLGPWTPVIEGDRLYGRGGADDGYAAFASLAAIEAVQAAGGSHARCIVLIEASEESGSPDLPAHVEALAARIGTPSLVVCLDSGCIDDRRLWVTTSLRGLVLATLTVEIVTEGLHSGDVSGMVPSTFRIARALLSRIEDETTGEILLPSCRVEVPAERLEQARSTAEEIGAIADHYPFVAGAGPTTPLAAGQLLARTWQAALSVVGADGLPPTGRAGNVLRPSTSLRLSLRTPPTVDTAAVLAELRSTLLADPPYGAKVSVSHTAASDGWNAPATAPWLAAALADASTAAFGDSTQFFGEGGSIPFMGMLGERFPDAQFVITGALLPDANAHGPNEYLHLPSARRVTKAIAHLLDAHAAR